MNGSNLQALQLGCALVVSLANARYDDHYQIVCIAVNSTRAKVLKETPETFTGV